MWIVSQMSGDARVVRGGVQPASLKVNARLAPGDTVVTGATGRATLVRDADYIVMAPRSELRLPATPQPTGVTRVMQNVGTMLFKVRRTGVPHFAVETPLLAAVVKGTTFTVVVDKDRSAVQVTEGAVQVTSLTGGMSQLVEHGRTVFINHSDPKTLIDATERSPGTVTTSSNAVKINGSKSPSVASLAALTGGLVRPVAAPQPAVAVSAPAVASPTPVSALSPPAPATPVASPVATDPLGTIIDTAAPSVSEPTVGIGDTTVPSVVEPVVDIVGTTVPSVIEPVVDIVDTTVPSVVEPLVDIVETTIPSVVETVVDIVDTTVPSVVEPVVEIVPVVTEPVVDIVDTTVPSVVEPVVEIVPVVTQPVVDIVDTTVPIVVEPVVEIVPVVTQPVVDILKPITQPVVKLPGLGL